MNTLPIVRDPMFMRFFMRLTLIITVTVLLGLGSVYAYFENDYARKINAFIEGRIATYESRFGAFDFNHTSEPPQVTDYIEEQLRLGNLLRFEMTDSRGRTVYAHPDDRLPEPFHTLFNDMPLPVSGKRVHFMIPDDGNGFMLFIARQLIVDNRFRGILKLAVPLQPENVRHMRQTMRRTVIAVIAVILLTLSASIPVIYRQYKAMQKAKISLLLSNLDTIRALGNAVALRDSNTNEHNYRVTYYSIKLAEAMQMPAALFATLIKGAFLHDIGKIGIPDTILQKQGPLTIDEQKRMQRHVALGLKLVRPVTWLQDAESVIGYHHEKYDGSGYPEGIGGDAIPLVARIFSVADVFDALTSERPYKKAFSLQASLDLLYADRGTRFDPAVVDAFSTVAEHAWHQTHQRDERNLQALLTDAVIPHIPAIMHQINA